MALLLLACAQQDPVAVCAGADCAPAPDAGAQSTYCEGAGPPLLVGDGITIGEADGSEDDVCSGRVAVRSFRFALCTCEDYATSTALVTDSFRSSEGPYQPGGTAGSVGSNGGVATGDRATVGGSLWVAGAAGVSLGGDLTVAGDLFDGGDLGGAVAVDVGRNAQVAGDVDVAALTVAGTLTLPDGSTLAVSGAQSVGELARADVAVPPPCACAPDELVDIAGFVAANRAVADNALIDLDPGALDGYRGDAALDLPCGRFYLDRIAGEGALVLRAGGRTALFVGGDITMAAPLRVELAPGAELDLFVAGLIGSDDRIDLGSPDQPARARLYLGGSGTVNLSGASLFAGNLYAPRAELVASAGAVLYGSLFVRRLVTSAPIELHYDADVLRADVGCPTTSTSCTSCLDCGTAACIDGSCGPCADTSDCCAPLSCLDGVCLP